MTDELKPSIIHSPNTEGVLTTFQGPGAIGVGQVQKLPWFSPGLLGLQNLLQVRAFPSELPRDLHLPALSSELDQPPPRSPQALLCGLGAPVGPVLASSWQLFRGKEEKGPGVLCSAKVGNLA